MDSRKFVLRQTLLIAIGQAVGVGVMLGIFALLGRFDYTVVLGGLVGALVALLNFFFMAVSLSLASDRAVQQDVKGGKGLVRSSYAIRTVAMFTVLFLCGKSGHCNVIALVVPLLLVQPTLLIAEFFRKKEE
jgi:hypothetical protein